MAVRLYSVAVPYVIIELRELLNAPDLISDGFRACRTLYKLPHAVSLSWLYTMLFEPTTLRPIARPYVRAKSGPLVEIDQSKVVALRRYYRLRDRPGLDPGAFTFRTLTRDERTSTLLAACQQLVTEGRLRRLGKVIERRAGDSLWTVLDASTPRPPMTLRGKPLA